MAIFLEFQSLFLARNGDNFRLFQRRMLGRIFKLLRCSIYLNRVAGGYAQGVKPACTITRKGKSLIFLYKSQGYLFCWGAKPCKIFPLGNNAPVPNRYVSDLPIY